MVVFDKTPDKLKTGHLINWVSIDELSIDNVDASTRLVFFAFSNTLKNLQKHVDDTEDKNSLLGTVLTTKNGAITIHNIFVKRTIDGIQHTNPFAALKGLRTVFDIIKDDAKVKCYIGKLDDINIWESLQKPIKALEGRHKITIWCLPSN